MYLTTPVCFFDPPQVIDCSVTPIPAVSSLPLQVIADTGLNLGVGVNFDDTTGEFIGIYIGAVGKETLVCIIGNGARSQGFGKFPPHSRVSVRNMRNATITNGRLTGQIVTV